MSNIGLSFRLLCVCVCVCVFFFLFVCLPLPLEEVYDRGMFCVVIQWDEGSVT